MGIHRADRAEPNHTSHADTQYTFGDTLPRPNNSTPRKLDSRKNASSASAASGAPKISPTNLE